MSTPERDMKALYNIGYGLYLLTTNDGRRDNGMIVNSVMQVASSPERLAVTINKSNYSHDTAKEAGKMNVCCLTEATPFRVFEHFGFQSGRDVDKFAECTPPRSENGLVYPPKYINSFMSLEVTDYIDLGSHGMFICNITEARIVGEGATMSYAYYHKNVKPKPEAAVAEKKSAGWVCTVCGYVHPEEELPEDFVCPLCKHGREVFEKIEE